MERRFCMIAESGLTDSNEEYTDRGSKFESVFFTTRILIFTNQFLIILKLSKTNYYTNQSTPSINHLHYEKKPFQHYSNRYKIRKKNYYFI